MPTSKLVSFEDFLAGADVKPLPGPDDNPAWPPMIDHLSASSLGTLDRCAEVFRRRYILGEVERPNINMTWGSAVHQTHEENFVQKIESHEDLDVRLVQDIYRQKLADSIVRDEEKTKKEMEWTQGLTFEKVIDRGVEMVAAYHLKASPRIQPIAVEQRFEVPFPGSPVPIIGFVDVETENRGIDQKTTARKEMKPEWRAQGHIYAGVLNKPLEYHLTVKTATPQVIVGSEWDELTIPFTPSSAMKAAHYIRQGVAKIQFLYQTYGPYEPWPGAYFQPGSRLCGICGFRPSCFWTSET